jgi:hypothetical protein
LTTGVIDTAAQQHPLTSTANGAHRGEAIAYRVSDGVYSTKMTLLAGDCEIQPGATITFKDDQTADFSIQQMSKHPSLVGGDYFHLSWAIGSEQIAGPVSGPQMTSANTVSSWQYSVSYVGPKPKTATIRWIGDC